MRKKFILFAGSVLLCVALWGQCPPRDTLRKRILYLKEVLKSPAQEQLKELLGYANNISDCPYKNDSTHVFLLGRIADIYFKEGNYLKAVQFRRQAIDITAENAEKPSVKVKSLPGRYYYLSVAYDSLNNFAEKMRALDSSSAIAVRLKYMDRAALIALYTRVEYFFDIGDYQRCIDYADKCELLGKEYADKNPGPEQAAGEGYVMSSIGWHVEALLKLNKFDEAEKLLIGKIDAYRKARLTSYLGLVNGQLAQVMVSKKNHDKALFYFNESLKYYKQGNDYFNYKQTLKDIGYRIYLRHYNDGDRALAYFKKALKFSDKNEAYATSDAFETLNIYSNIGSIYAGMKLYDSAFKYFQLAFDKIRVGINEENILQLAPQELTQFKRNYYVTDLLLSKAQAYRQLFEDKGSKDLIDKEISIYKVTDRLLDRIKSEQAELESKLFWRSDSRRLYERAIESCYLQGNVADAFYFFEKSRAVLLNDQLNEKRFVAEQDIMRQTELKKKITKLKTELDAVERSSARFSDLQKELFSFTQDLDRLQQVIKANNPVYYQSFLDTGFITLKLMQEELKKSSYAFLELFAGDSAVYVLQITPANCYLEKINKPDYDSTTNRYISYITDVNLLNRDYKGFLSTSHHLYNLLFEGRALASNRVVISPDGQYFPFESLVVSKPGRSVAWFLNDHAVSYTYSTRFLMNDFSVTTGGAGKNFMGLAPVDFMSSLPSLKGSDQSLQEISSHFYHPKVFLSSHASRANFLGHYSKYRVIQLYTHAAGSSKNDEPVIYFSDSALYLSELIGEYRPSTELVVLSACETALGQNYKGEGVFSFNRGFAALGIPAAITNLWSVDNEATYALTELFYKWLAKGLPTDVALQRAKLEFLQSATKQRSMPFYWAAPVLIGKAGTIEIEKPATWKWIVVIVVVAGVAFWALRRRQLNNAKQKATQT